MTGAGLFRLIETLAAATAGGAAVWLAGIPGAWLSGAMMATAFLTMSGRGTAISGPVRQAALALAGTTIGAGVTPQMLETFSHYPASLALMTVSLAIAALASMAFIMAVSNWSRATALFASIPGALSYVLAIAPEAGADIARVAVAQLLRIFVLIALIPLVFGGAAGGAGAIRAGVVDGPLWIVAILALGLPLGLLFERLGISGGMLFGGMLVAGLAHGGGFAPGRLPDWLQIVGQVLIGAWSGSRFAQLDLALLRSALVASLGSFVVAGAISVGFAALTSFALGLPIAEVVLAFAPGGLEAMTLLAFTLGLDPLYVGSHHLARFIALSLAMPIAVKLILGRRTPPAG